jgi:activating signal cointegrator 1
MAMKESQRKPIRALTVRQPHALRIVTGDKMIENRPMPTKHRGVIAIHAAKTTAELSLNEEGRDACGHHVKKMHFMKVIGTVELVDCIKKRDVEKKYPRLAKDPDLKGPSCWILAHPKQLRSPVTTRGQLGLWWWRR